jgi:hypothetical protein
MIFSFERPLETELFPDLLGQTLAQPLLPAGFVKQK